MSKITLLQSIVNDIQDGIIDAILQSDSAKILTILEQAHISYPNDNIIIYDAYSAIIIRLLDDEDLFILVLNLLDILPNNHIYRALSFFIIGCEFLKDPDTYDAGVDFIQQCHTIFTNIQTFPDKGLWGNTRYMPEIFSSIEDIDEACQQENFFTDHMIIQHEGALKTADIIYIISCNPPYFEKCFDKFYQQFHSTAHIHLHLSCEDSYIKEQHILTTYPNISLSTDTLYQDAVTPTFFSYARFLIAYKILTQYQTKTIIISDIDIQQSATHAKTHQAIMGNKFDVGYFPGEAVKHLPPWHIFCARHTYVHNTASAQKMLYVATMQFQKIHEYAHWMSDQAILFSTMQYMKTYDEHIRFLDFTNDAQILENELISTSDVTYEQKQILRTQK